LKGGGLARAAAPASVRALILSDVVGDPLDVIASGPVSPDPTTFEDASAVLRERGVWSRVPANVRSRLEAGAAGLIPDTPDATEALFRNVTVSVIGNAARAAEAAAAAAARLGYRATVESVTVTGEARNVGSRLGGFARGLPSGECRILAGETTVTVRGDGRGGRNQEVALSAAEMLAGRTDVLLFSVGTDGVDGPTDAAGAWVTGTTLERARKLGLDPGAALDRNDSYSFFREMDDLVITGPTGTNVMDLMGILAGLPGG
jgi:glycerate 2-kinase